MLSGGIVGGSMSVLALAVASLLGETPAGRTPPAAPQIEAPEVAAAVPEAGTAPADPSVLNDNPVQPRTPGVVQAAPEGDVPMAETTPAPMPQAGAISGDLMAPAAGTVAQVDLSAVEPVLPNPQSVAPQVPMSEGDLTLATDPAQPRAPAIGAVDPLAPQGSPQEAFIVLDSAAPLDVDAPAPIIPVDIPDFAPQVTAANPDAPPVDVALEATPDTPETTAEAPQAGGVAPAPPLPRVGLSGEPAGSMPTGTAAVQVRRPGATTTPDIQGALTADTPALLRYAAPFDSAETRPLMAVILIDDGTLPEGPEVLAGVPFPVTIALDPGRSGVAAAMTAYRAAGIELVALTKLPAGAQPSDVEVTYAAAFATLPETVALLDAGEGGLQGDRATTAQAVDILAADGRGLIAPSGLLNPALRAAEKAAVPAGVIYRDLDGGGQDAAAIRRFLDGAAFQARRESGVILLARLRPQTVSALILWGTVNRDGQVAFAPVSAVLKVTAP